MTTPEGGPLTRTSEAHLTELLSQLTHDFTPEGCSVELTDLKLNELDPGVDYSEAFKTVLGIAVTDTATFNYSYDPRTGNVGLETVRFGLKEPLKENNHLLADGLYLRRTKDAAAEGYLVTYGLGATAFEPGSEEHTMLEGEALADFKYLLSIPGLTELGNGDNPLSVVPALERSTNWEVAETMNIPLSSTDPDHMREMTIARFRSMVPAEADLDDMPEEELLDIDPEEYALARSNQEPSHNYNDDYTLTLRTISMHPEDGDKRVIQETTLMVANDFKYPTSYMMFKRGFTRFPNPDGTVGEEVISEEEYFPDVTAFAHILEHEYFDAF